MLTGLAGPPVRGAPGPRGPPLLPAKRTRIHRTAPHRRGGGAVRSISQELGTDDDRGNLLLVNIEN
jgi:hypothetical protein